LSCTHQRRYTVVVYANDLDEPYDRYDEVVEPTTEDLDIGRYRCTQCGEVFYYTGYWRDFHEKGASCPGSEGLKSQAGKL
jgi:uncharacterized protein with PIN domain